MVNTVLHGQITDSYAIDVDTFDGNPDTVDALTCDLCRTHVGLASGDAEYPTTFTPYYAVHLAGDAADTLFCEDCAVLLADTTTTTQGDLS